MRRCLTVFLLSLFLAGCVTEEYGVNANREIDPEKEVQDNLRLAKAYIQEGYTARAIEPLSRAMEIDSSNAEVYAVFAIIYQYEGDTKNARMHYEKAISYDSEASDVQNNFGVFLYNQKEYEEAITHLLAAAQNIRYPGRVSSYELLGLCELRLDNTEKAEKYFVRALRLERGLYGASLELADLYYQREQYNLALVNFERYLEYTEQAQTARSLLLGIHIARVFSDSDREASYALQLNRFYPGSPELKQYEMMGKL